MGIEVVRQSERAAVAEPVQADAEMARLSALIDGSFPRVAEDEPKIASRGHEGGFRALFLGIADDCSPLTLGTADLRASEASTAMREAICMRWPPQAIGFRLLDLRRPGGGWGQW